MQQAEDSKIDVLDHGFVRLVEYMGSDLSVARSARVSYDAAWRAGEDQGSDARLINYLWKNRHVTPFEAVVFQFEVMAPIFVFRQWQRHRTWPFWSINELSARYKELPRLFYVPDIAVIGTQSASSKQARVIEEEPDENVVSIREVELELYRKHCEAAFDGYEHMLRTGWPRELARGVLPLSTYTHLFGKVDLHNLFHFLTLRLDPHAQYEIRVYAEAILQLIEPIIPICVKAWKEN